MTTLFSCIVNMSLTGSMVILLVMTVRLALKKFPKVFSYALWSVVLFRLLCPVSISAPGSFLRMLRPDIQQATQATSMVTYLPVPEEEMPVFQYVPATFGENEQAERLAAKEDWTPEKAAAASWLAGICVMGLYSLLQYWFLRRRLLGAARVRGNIYAADHIDTAFVMGIFRPRIYLPTQVPPQERKYILAHEQNHIRRGDHIWKLLAYSALCLHWFNPLVWLAFVQAGKDMEMSCDEAVIRRFGPQIRAAYSASLLRLATHRKTIAGVPLAFGEGDTKGRIVNMAKWRKPRLWASVLCGILCIAILAACAVNPQQAEPVPESTYMETMPREEAGSKNILLVILPEGENAAKLGDSTLVLSLNEKDDAFSIQSIPGEQVVSLPDYQNHTTGNEAFRTCYALGYVWGGRTAAMEMANICVEESFGIHVDYNVEMTWSEIKDLIDSFGGVRVPLEENELAELAQMDNPVLKDAKPGMLYMDGETAVAYAQPQNDEDNPELAERCRLRQRKLLAVVFSEIRENPQLAEALPPLYRGDDLNGTPENWTALLKYLGAHTTFYLTGTETEKMPETPTVTGADIVTDTQLVQYGSLKLLLPSGYSSYAQDNEVILTKDGVDVGGIRCYRAPDVPYDFSIEYLRALGLPEAQETEEPIAYMMSGSGGVIEVEFFHELRPETLNVEHHIYADGDLVYDLYYDQNLLNDVQADKFLRTVVLNEEPVYPQQVGRDENLQLVRTVLEGIQAGTYQIAVDRRNQEANVLNASSATVYTARGSDWVSITHVPDDDSYHGFMEVTGTRYSNEGTGWNEDGLVNWAEDPYPDEVYIPWLANFRWDEELITYDGCYLEEGKKFVILRIDEPFPGYEDLTTCYFVDVIFTEEGNFLNVNIDIVYAQGTEVSYVEISEAIVTLDEETVDAYITKEYNRAVSAS